MKTADIQGLVDPEIVPAIPVPLMLKQTKRKLKVLPAGPQVTLKALEGRFALLERYLNNGRTTEALALVRRTLKALKALTALTDQSAPS